MFRAAKRFRASPSCPPLSVPFRKTRSLFLNRILILSLLPAILLSATCTFTSSSATCRGTQGGDGAVGPCPAAAPQTPPDGTKPPPAVLRSSPPGTFRGPHPPPPRPTRRSSSSSRHCSRRSSTAPAAMFAPGGSGRASLPARPGGCNGGALLRTAVAVETEGEAAPGGAEPLSEDAGRSMAICTPEGGVQPPRRLRGQSMAASFRRGPPGKRRSDVLKGIDIAISVDAGPLKSERLPPAFPQASVCPRSPFSY